MSLASLLKYFPPPKFLNPNRIGISFSDTSIKAISFNEQYDPSSIKSLIVPIDQGIITNGVLVKEEEFIKKLSEVKDKFDTPFAHFTLPDELVYIYSTKIPVTPNKDSSEAVAFTIEENVPLPLSDTIFDFSPISIHQTASGFEGSFVVVASVRKEVEKFLNAIRQAGFEPMGCIHESQAVANSVVLSGSQSLYCLIHARENRIGIYLVKNNLVFFVTLRSITEGDYEKHVADEYDKFLEYYHKYSESKDIPIESISICGEFEYAKKALSSLGRVPSLSGKTILSNVWANIFSMQNHIPSLPFEKSLSFAGSIGSIISKI